MRLNHKHRLLLLAAIAAAIFITSFNLWQGKSQVFRGRYTDGFETSRFVPCGSTEKWWAQGNIDPIYRAYYADFDEKGLPEDSFHTGYVEIKGRVTRQGSYGHEGNYDRAITIEEVIKVQTEIPSTCE